MLYKILALLLLFPMSLSAQELPVLKDVKINGLIQFDSVTGIYSFLYSIKNSNSSSASIQRIEIDLTKPSGSADLSDKNLNNAEGYLKDISDEVWTTSGSRFIPVGFASIPDKWLASLTSRVSGKWASEESEFRIASGKSLSGFVLMSYGLPTIREFKAEPWIDVNEFYSNVDELESVEEVNALLAKIKQDKENAAFKGETIGPTAPPADFKPVDFLSNIINMKHEAYKLGWIKNEGILKSLDAKLENAKKDMEKGNTRSAKNTLKAFINEIEAQGCESYENCPSGKHLTSEAYGLLKYNAQYLIDRL